MQPLIYLCHVFASDIKTHCRWMQTCVFISFRFGRLKCMALSSSTSCSKLEIYESMELKDIILIFHYKK